MATMTSTAPNSLPSRPHIPKLSYRTTSDPNSHVRRPSTSTVATSNSDTTLYTPFPAPPSPLTSPTTGIFPDSLPGPQSTPSSPSFPISNMPNKTKSKGSSFSNFFTVKEPSSKAFSDYEEYMHKQSASRGGRVIAVGLPGVSSTKLPSTVPKVNSKWDGIPQAVKDRGKEKEKDGRLSSSLSLGSYRPWSHSRSDDSLSLRSSRSSGSQSACRDQIVSCSSHKISSSTSRNVLGMDGPPTSPPGHIPNFAGLPEIPREYLATENTSATEVTPTGRLPSSCSHSSPSNLPREVSTPEYTHERSCADSYFGPPSLSTSPYSSAPGTPLDSSPITPLDLPPFEFLQPTIAVPQESGDGIKTTVLEMPLDSAVLLKSAGPNILGPPASAKRGLAAQSLIEGEKADGVKPLPILRKGPTSRTAQQPIRPPLSSDKLHIDQQPSHSINTPQVRPVMRSPKSYVVAPWELSDPPPASTTREQDSTPTPMSGGGPRRKSKISIFARSP